jgi:hypothetical protein
MTDTRLYYSTAANASSAVPPGLHENAVKTTPVDADELPLADSTLGWSYRRLSWANLKLAVGVYYNTLTATLTNKTITSPKINKILDSSGAVSMEFTTSAAELEAEEPTSKIGVNYFGVINSAAGVAPMFAVWGTDTNVPMHFRTKGTSGYKFLVGGGGTEFVNMQTDITDPGGAIGRLEITNAPITADNPTITLKVPATAGKPNSVLNLNPEGTEGAVRVNGVPVVTGSPSGSVAALKIWTGTKAQYDAIVTKSSTTIYVVTTAVAAVTGDITVDEGAQTGDIVVEEPAADPAADAPVTKTTRKK